MGCLQSQEKRRVLLLGLDGAGKTTALHAMKCGERVHTVPTIGFNVESVTYQGIDLNIWDVGGQDNLRDLWRHYYPGTNGLMFIVDSADRDRIHEAKRELHLLMQELELRYTSLIVIANKQDLPNAFSIEQITQELELNKIERKHKCFAATAISNEGIGEAMDWLIASMIE